MWRWKDEQCLKITMQLFFYFLTYTGKITGDITCQKTSPITQKKVNTEHIAVSYMVIYVQTTIITIKGDTK